MSIRLIGKADRVVLRNTLNEYGKRTDGTMILICTGMAPGSGPGAISVHVVWNREQYNTLSCVVRKSVFGVSDLVQHKPGCTTLEDS